MKKNIIFIVGSFFFLLSQLVFAIDIVQIDQPKIRLSISPGGKKTGVINVVNTSSEEKQIRVYLEDWYYSSVGDGSKEFRPVSSLANSCASWINFSPAEFSLPAYAKQVVGYTVKVPQEAKGGYYAILFFENLLAKPEEKEGLSVGVGVAIRLGSLFYIEPEGTIKREARIEKLSLEKKDRDLLEIRADFKNIGNVDITASATFNIIDKIGMVLARGEFNNVYTFAGDAAKLIASWKELIPEGKYDLILTLDLGRALEETGLGRGPVIVKETEIEIGENGKILRVGELR